MQRPPLFESDHFIYWKNRFETYVKAKDLDLWHIILNGDFSPLARNKETQILEIVPFEQQDDDLKRKLAKNNEAKMVLYNALPKKEYERSFMCKTAKDIWQSLLITHQCNSQVKDNKIDLLVQQYEQFTILEEDSIDSGFARFNTIITRLKALNEGFSSKNYAKRRVKSIALKAKKESSDDETLTSRSDDEEYDMVVRNFKSSLVERVNLLGNQEKKRSHFDKGMRRKERVTGNALVAVIQIISLVIVQNHLVTKIKRHSLEVLEAIAEMTPKTKLTMKLASWLNCQMRESLNVTFYESPPPTKLSSLVDDDVGLEEAIRNNTKVVNNNNEEDELIEVDEVVNIKESKNHPLDQAIGDLNQRTLRSQAQDHSNFFCFISTIKPKDVNEALKDES
nr:DUF4219 domain-containing protein/UBN2 domain-containing protein [Tanacetum cinerariifolium]